MLLLIIRMATAADIPRLIELRLAYLRTDHGALPPARERMIRAQLGDYFPRHIGHDFLAFLAEKDEKIVSCAFLVLVEKPANLNFMTGLTGTVLNVLTFPEYRRQGIAKAVLTALIEKARSLGVSQLELSATLAGRPLYENLGFSPAAYTSMRLSL